MDEKPEKRSSGDHFSRFPTPKAVFLRHMSREQNRLEAAKQANVRWSEVQQWLVSDEDFATEYEDLMQERLLVAEDTIFLAAKNDRNAAAAGRTLELVARKKRKKGASDAPEAADIAAKQDRARAILEAMGGKPS